MKKRKLDLEIIDEAMSIEEIQVKVTEVKEKQAEMVEKGVEMRNQELLDLYNRKIEVTDEKSEKKKESVP